MIDVKLLKKELEKKEVLSDLDLDVRKFLNLLTKKKLKAEDYDFINNCKVNVFLGAYKELKKEKIEDMIILNDMVVGEYAKMNVDSIKVAIDDEEDDIY